MKLVTILVMNVHNHSSRRLLYLNICLKMDLIFARISIQLKRIIMKTHNLGLAQV
jgi:hypothetical protein